MTCAYDRRQLLSVFGQITYVSFSIRTSIVLLKFRLNFYHLCEYMGHPRFYLK